MAMSTWTIWNATSLLGLFCETFLSNCSPTLRKITNPIDARRWKRRAEPLYRYCWLIQSNRCWPVMLLKCCNWKLYPDLSSIMIFTNAFKATRITLSSSIILAALLYSTNVSDIAVYNGSKDWTYTINSPIHIVKTDYKIWYFGREYNIGSKIYDSFQNEAFV